MTTTVWLLQDGAKYEGYTVIGVYATHPLAAQAQERRVREKHEYGLGVWDMTTKPGAPLWWDRAGWHYVGIQEFPVVSSGEGIACSP